MRAEQRLRHRRRRIVALGTAGAAAAGLTAIIVSVWPPSQASGIAGVQSFFGLARTHVTGPVSYRQRPPVGGPHNPEWLNCGIYLAPVPDTNAVHSLEHGAVWIAYRPNLPASAVRQLRSLVATESPAVRGYVIVSPYPGLPSAVVASAWGKQLRLSSPGDVRLPEFVARYAQGPQTPEPGAPCSGGVGTPMP
jgi:hypothetical protein